MEYVLLLAHHTSYSPVPFTVFSAWCAIHLIRPCLALVGLLPTWQTWVNFRLFYSMHQRLDWSYTSLLAGLHRLPAINYLWLKRVSQQLLLKIMRCCLLTECLLCTELVAILILLLLHAHMGQLELLDQINAQHNEVGHIMK